MKLTLYASAEVCTELMACSLISSCCCYTCCIRRKLHKMSFFCREGYTSYHVFLQ
ncbi:hypothetical protein ACSBR1_034487 [Camellia fascicularis]